MMNVMKHNGKVVTGYLVSDEGRVFYGKNRTEVKPFLKKGQYHFNIVMNKKVVALNAVELILTNFENKPKDGTYVAAFKQNTLNSSTPLNKEALYWKKVEGKAFLSKTTMAKSELDKMKSVFVDGVLTNYLVSRLGEVFTREGKKVEPKISRRGRPYIEVPMPYNMGFKEMNLADLVITSYKLPANDFLINYHVSYLDGDKKNCSECNLILWKEGHAGIARKKWVKVFKDGKFFGAFDSVKKCSSVIDIPRRRISELLQSGLAKNGFMVQEFKMW